jgi:DNA modification methylase
VHPKHLLGIPWRVAFALQADGWYFRQDIIWHKPNPMPESVTDRCTKAHEYVFLLSKSERYYFDQEAIKEDSVTNDARRPYGSKGAWDMDGRPEEQRHGGEPRSFKGSKFNTGKTAIHQLNRSSDSPRVTGSLPGRDDGGRACNKPGQEKRTKRSVWTVNTRPYKEAHFATFPPALITPMILAGCPSGGTCIDPFGGSGTVGEVCESLGRNSILIELNPAYIEMQGRRTAQQGFAL